jgi:hypothetical protein
MKAMNYYVSVTGLKVKSLWYYPSFYKHAIPCVVQAKSSPGNVFTDTRMRNGIQHTLTVWKDKASMLLFLRSGGHAQAMKVTKQISDLSETKVYGYESDTMPTWEEALALWEEHGTYHGKKPTPKKAEASSGWVCQSVLCLAIVTVAAASSAKVLLY